MSNVKTLELRTLDDEELMDVVGGGGGGCYSRKRDNDCHPQCGCDGGFEVILVVGILF